MLEHRAVPTAGDYRALTVHDVVPAGHAAVPVMHDRWSPHIRAGEFAVLDPSDTDPQVGELYGIMISSPRFPSGWVLKIVQPYRSALSGRDGVMYRFHPQDLVSFLARPEPEGTAEFRFRAASSEVRWARCSRVALTDEAGAVEAVLGVMVDITPERVRETAWAEMATHDPLTGLLNRRGLRQEVDRLSVESSASPCLALFAVDLDRFKETNDTHDHAAGDAVLVEVARRLVAIVPGAPCARLGGDEFVVVLSVPNEEEARETRARLWQAFRRPLAFRGRWLPVSASVGVACGPGSVDIARLMDDADADLYGRKRAGTPAQIAAA